MGAQLSELTAPGPDRPVPDRRRRDRQPRDARAARRHRQLVRAPAGAPPRRRAAGLGDGLQPRDPPPQRADDAGAADDPPGRAPGLDPALRLRSRGDARRGDGRRRRRRRPDRPEHGLPGARRCARPEPAPSCSPIPTSPSPSPRAAVEGGRGRPVTVKLRSGLRPGDASGVGAGRAAGRGGRRRGDRLPSRARRRSSTRASPDYALVRELAAPRRRAGDRLRRARLAPRAPARAYELSGGRRGDDRPRQLRQPLDLRGADRASGRGARRREEIAEELLWVVARAEEHLGERRASHYLRKFYPWYVERLGIGRQRGGRVPAPDRPRAGSRADRTGRSRG